MPSLWMPNRGRWESVKSGSRAARQRDIEDTEMRADDGVLQRGQAKPTRGEKLFRSVF